MARNNRLAFYCQQVGVAGDGLQSFTPVKGVQSVQIETNFNLELALELGQIQVYQNIENIPDVTVTLTRLLDGNCPFYLLMTSGAPAATLPGRSTIKSIIALDTFPETVTSATGVPLAECQMSGQYPNSIQFSFPIDGNATETITCIGNNKVWTTGVGTFAFTGAFPGNAQPLSIGASGGINRRQHMVFTVPTGLTALDVNGQLNATFTNPVTILPPNIDGITSSGTNPTRSDGFYSAYIQNVNCSVDLNRTPIYQQGRKSAFDRYVPFPVQTKTDIDVISALWDGTSATEAGVAGFGNNLTNCTIKIALQEGLFLDLGTNNKPTSVTFGGGDTNGGNVVQRLSYQSFNDFSVMHPQDPSKLTS